MKEGSLGRCGTWFALFLRLGCVAPTALAFYLQLSFEGMW